MLMDEIENTRGMKMYLRVLYITSVAIINILIKKKHIEVFFFMF